jgi:hypothetical protein
VVLSRTASPNHRGTSGRLHLSCSCTLSLLPESFHDLHQNLQCLLGMWILGGRAIVVSFVPSRVAASSPHFTPSPTMIGKFYRHRDRMLRIISNVPLRRRGYLTLTCSSNCPIMPGYGSVIELLSAHHSAHTHTLTPAQTRRKTPCRPRGAFMLEPPPHQRVNSSHVLR